MVSKTVDGLGGGFAGLLLDALQRLNHLSPHLAGKLRTCGQIGIAGFGCYGEPRRNRNADSFHFCEIGTFTAQIGDPSDKDAAMAQQRKQSRSVTTFTETSEAYRTLSAEGFKPEFKGYDDLTADSTVMLLVKDGQAVDAATAGDRVEIVAKETPFYGEAGGQAGDIGTITAPDGGGLQVDVQGTVKDPTGLIIHTGHVVAGRIATNDPIRLSVSAEHMTATPPGP